MPKALGELPRHQDLAVADRDHAAARHTLHGLHVLVGDLAAADDGDPDAAHGFGPYWSRNRFIASASGTRCFQPSRSRSFWLV